MNTKEHINSLKELITCKGCTLEISQETIDTINEIIRLLQRGGKYEAIVSEIMEFLEPGVITEIPEGMVGSRHIDIIKYTLENIKQKYFPSPVKKNITIEFEAKSEDLIDRTIKSLKSVVEGWYSGVVKVNIKEYDNVSRKY